jgi:glucose/arabinose dehydrogenase
MTKPDTGKKVLGLTLFTLLSGGAVASAQTVMDPALRVEEDVSGLDSPTSMALIGLDDVLVLQKDDGLVRRARNGVLQPTAVLDVAVDGAGERGLLGIALHPSFRATPWVYLYYTESSTGSDTFGTPEPLGNRVYRYEWDGTALVDPTLILHLPAGPSANHNGGTIGFGPDGKLYAIIGDLGRFGQLQNSPAGAPPDDTSVILRLNDDGSIPADNPFFGQSAGLDRYFAYGIRNSFGFTFDPLTGDLWASENGPQSYDEINRAPPGFNSGWMPLMGPDARDPQGAGDLFVVPGSQYSDPEFSWLDTVAPTALSFLASPLFSPEYENDLIVGDFNQGTLYRFEPNAARDGLEFVSPDLHDLVADAPSELDELVFGTGFMGITDLDVGVDGSLYVLSFLEGKIDRISPEPAVDLSLMAGASSVPRGGHVPLQITFLNTTREPQSFAFALLLSIPGFADFLLLSPIPSTLPASGSAMAEPLLGPIPLNAPLGQWTLKGLVLRPRVGGVLVIDRSITRFTVN